MRVLWFSATPAGGAELVGRPPAEIGGWVASLEEAVATRQEVDLAIAFPWEVPEVRPLAGGRHDYLALPRYPRGGRLQRRWIAHACRLEPDAELDHLQRAVELARPDLVHVFGTEAVFGRVAERTELPVLVEIQGLSTQCAEEYCRAFSRLDLLRYGSPRRLLAGRSLLHRYYRYRRRAEREQRILANARFVCGRTRWDRQSCAVLAPRARYFHCDRLLRPAFRQRRWRRRSAPAELRLVSTIRGNAYKGLDTAYRCAEILRKTGPGGLCWTIIGVRHGEELHRMVERKFGGTCDERGIRLVGRQAADEVARRLLENDLYVHPSWIDNSPNGIAEAMAIGMPIVSTSVGGIPSLVGDAQQGLLVPPGDPWAMAGAIRRLADDPELADRLAAGARETAARRHDPASVAETLVGIYRQILSP